jgi:uncharacterized protein YkwD
MNRTPWLVATLAALLVALTSGTAQAKHYDHLLASAKRCPGQTDRALPSAAQERVMRCMHNHARARAGLWRLRPSSLLNASAERKSGDMLRCGFSHNACGRSPDFWIVRVGYGSCSWRWGWAENIAWMPRDDATVRRFMSSWLHSDGHRYNLMSRAFNDIGLGYRRGAVRGHAGASVWTAHFSYSTC